MLFSALQDRALQAGKFQKVTIERYPLASPFDRERCVPGVGCHWATCVCFNAKTLKDVPVPFAWLERYAMGLGQQTVAERERGGDTTDAWYAALAIEWGCEWVTFDRDFRRFPSLKCTILPASA